MISRFALLCFLAVSSCLFNNAPLTTTSINTNFGGINAFVQAAEETSEFLSSGAWATVQLAFNDGGVETSCPCPVGCMNCAFQDSSMFGGDNTVKTLYSTSTMPTMAISTGGSATFAGYTNTTGTAERMTLQVCPDVSLMVCFNCNNGHLRPTLPTFAWSPLLSLALVLLSRSPVVLLSSLSLSLSFALVFSVRFPRIVSPTFRPTQTLLFPLHHFHFHHHHR